jgi:glutathione S-transferase
LITLYELAGADENCRFSPFVWRIRLALAHKGLDPKCQPMRFLEKEIIAPSGSKTVPVINDDGHWVADSWDIACYLEDKYSDRPSLFGGDLGKGQAFFINNWVNGVLHFALFPMYVLDIYNHIAESDKPYFRESREKRLGRSLEEVQAGRAQGKAVFDKAIMPLQHTLKTQPFICGNAPAYADYCVFGAFQWVRAVSDYKLLETDDPVYVWRGRMLDLYDGMAAKSVGYPV